jgi:hypothetical protein
MLGLLRDHAKQMQRVGVLRLLRNDLTAKRFRLSKIPRSVVLEDRPPFRNASQWSKTAALASAQVAWLGRDQPLE